MAEDPNTLKSRSLIRLVEVLSEGEIVGLDNGARSIYFDETAYQSPDGTYNFKDVQWELRTGTSNQEPLPGFDGVETEISVSRKVTASFANGGLGPYTFTVNDNEVDAIRIKIRLNALNTSTNSGKIKATSVSFKIEVQPNGEAYQTRVTDTISGKTTSPYERQYRVDLPGSGPWNIRVTRLTADSDQVNLQNDTYVASYTVIKDVKLRYNDTAVLGLVLTAEAFGNSIPRRAFLVKGLKIKVPENYDPETRAYATSGSGTSNGAWNGTFKTAWTNNPAWVFYDLLTNDRYGLGQYIDAAQVDKWALYDIAQYCDQLVPDGFGGQEPRFTINAVINSAREAYDVLQTITSVFRGMAYWGAGVVTAVQDKPKDPVKIVNQTNVIDGQFTYTSSGLKDRHSVALITWNDPDDFYRPAVEVIEDPQLILRYGYRPIELVAYGCTSRGQAYRLGKWLLDTESSERETVNYTASFDHLDVRPGDIIEVADPAIAGSRQGGRIQDGSTTTSIKLDVPIRIYSGDTLTTVKADGTLMERALQPTASPVSTVTATSAFPEAPDANAVYAIGGGLVENRPFRVVSVTENEKHLFDVSAVTYDPNKFARVELGLKFEDPNYSNLTRGTVLPPTNLLFQQGDYRANNQIRSYLVASWTQPNDPRISHYEYRVTTPSGGQDAGWTQTTSASVEFDNIEVGTWSIEVRCVTIDNRKSAYVTDDILVTGRTIPPGTPTNLVAATGLDQISLTWTNPPDIDLDYIEVWGLETTDVNTAIIANATQIAEVDSSAFIHTSLTPGDHWYYWVRAVDLVGNIGEYSNRSDAVAGSASSVSSVVGYLTNESHTVATLVDGAGGNYTNAGGTFAVYEGTTDKTGNAAVTYSVVSGSVTGGLSISIASTGIYTVTGLTSDNGTATLRAVYNGVTLNKVYSITKSKQGDKGGSGDASKVISLNADRQIFKYDNAGNASPAGQYITLSLVKQNTTATTSWFTNPTVTLYDTPSGSGGIVPQGTVSQDFVYLRIADFGSNNAVTITAQVSDGAVFNDRVTIVRVQDGATGSAGQNAVVGYLTNENHTVPATTTGSVSSYAGATGTFKVFWGTSDVTTGQGITYSTLTNNQSLTNGGSGVLINASTGQFTIDGGLDIGEESAVVVFRAVLPAGLGGGNVDKVFSLNKSKTGSTGADSKLMSVYSDKQTFTFDGTNTLNPAGQYVTFTASKQNTTQPITWSTSPSVSLRSTTSASSSVVTTGDTVYLHAADFAANTAVTVTATLSDGVVLTDKITIVKVRDGATGTAAITGYLTNESQTVPATNGGAVSSYAGASGTFRVFSGNVDVTTGQSIVYSTIANNSGLTNAGTANLINSSTGAYNIDGGLLAGTDTATATFRATLPAGLGGSTVDKVFTITKSKAGLDGTSPKILTIRSDYQAFTYDGTGGADPAGQVIRFDADKQNTTANVTWTTSPSVSLYTAATGGTTTTSGNTVYLRIADFGFNNSVTVTGSLTDGTTLTDTITIVRVQDGAQGNPGSDAVLYYIKPVNGTAIKNSTGTLTVEARKVTGGTDSLLSTGTIQLYVGTTLVNTTNGFATGSNGYTGVFDSTDITGDVIVLLKDGAAGAVLDSITLVDVLDGTNGADGVYGYIEPTGPLAWTRAVDQTTWSPVGTTVDLPCTFVQGGVAVARVSWRVTRSATGALTGATVAHPSGDLNASRVTVTEINEGGQSFSVRFNYSFGGFTSSVAETVITSLSGSNGSNGVSAVSGILTNEAHVVAAASDGTGYTLTNSGGTFKMWSGTSDVTGTSIFNITGGVDGGTSWTKVQNGLTLTINETTGVYSLSGSLWTTDSETFTMTGTYNGVTITRQYVIAKSKNGVSSTVYQVEPSVSAVVKGSTGVYTPATVTYSAYSITGTAARTAYAGRFIIATSVDGVTYTDQYTSASNQSSYVYTVPAGITLIRARLYAAGGTTTLLDEQSVAIIANGTDGVNGNNVAQVYAYKRSATAPIDNPGAVTYDFVTGSISTATLANSWSKTIPAGTSPLYVVVASAVSSTSTDSIAAGEWSTPVILAQNGTDGLSASVLSLTTTSQTFTYDGLGVPLPASQTITFTANLQNLAGTATFTATAYNSAGTSLGAITLGGTGNTRTMTNAQFVAPGVTAYAIVTATLNSFSDTVTIVKLANGGSGTNGVTPIVGFLTNEAITLAAASDGTVSSFATAVGTFRVFEGITERTTVSAFSVVGTPTNCTVAINATTGAYSVSAMTADTASATFQAIYGGVTIQKGLSLSKSRTGTAGNNGLNSATVFLYQRTSSSTAPTVTTTGASTYTFADGTISGQPAGWTRAIPSSGGGYLWIIQATAAATSATDSINNTEWSVPVLLSQDGAQGVPGLNNAIVYIYQRAAAAPALPSVSTTYTFSTRTLTGLNNGWTTTIPAGTNPLYVSAATASSTTDVDTIANTEWAATTILVQNGTNGTNGLNSATVYLFQRTATTTPPAVPSTTITYTFATGAATGTLGSWTRNMPTTGGIYRWVTTATAVSTSATDDIATSEWATPSLLSQDGLNGADGRNVATVFVYQRTSTNSAPAVPSVDATYTFATGAITGLNNGWTSTIPAFTTGNIYLWATFATASATTATDIISTTEWAVAQKLSQDGTNGTDGYNTATLTAYKRSATAPIDNPGTLTYTFATASWTPGNSWSKTIPAGSNPCYAVSATAFANTATDSVASTDWSSPVIIVENGTSPLTMTLTNDAATIMAYANGTVVSFAPAIGQLTVWKGNVNVTASSTLSATASTGLTGTVNTASGVPVAGQPAGYYQVTALAVANDTGTLTLNATYNGESVSRVFSIAKSKVGYEIVSVLPTTNLFEGRIVYLSTEDVLYRYITDSLGVSSWSKAVPAADLTGTIDIARFSQTIRPVEVLAALPTTGNFAGRMVFLTSDRKLYRYDTSTSSFSRAVDGADIIADSITAGQIQAGAIGTSELSAGAVTAGKLAVFDAYKPFSNVFENVTFVASTATVAEQQAVDWVSYAGSGEVSVAADSPNVLTGGKALVVGNNLGDDMRWFVGSRNIVFDPNSMYKVSCRIRRSAGIGNAYIGLAGISDNGSSFVSTTGLNEYLNQHYITYSATSGFLADGTTSSAIGTSFIEFVGYVKGHAAAGVNGTAVASPITAPAKMHASVRYIRPLLVVNHNATAGTTIVDYFEIEKVSSATLIEPGSITTSKISTFAITADQISAGAVTAAKLFGTELSALKAELGNVVISTAGSLRSGQTGYNTGTGFWLGTDAGTPKFSIGNPSGQYMTWDGTSLNVTKAQIQNAYITNSVLGPSSARIATSASGHTAPFFVSDTAATRNGTIGTKSATIGEFLAPDYSTTGSVDYERKRLAFRKTDVTLQIMAAGAATGQASASLAVDYMINGVWNLNVNTLALVVFDFADKNAAFGVARYTTIDTNNWQRMRIKLTVGNCLSIALTAFIQNTEESANTAGSIVEATTGSTPSGASPTPPTWSYDPNWSIDPYLLF